MEKPPIRDLSLGNMLRLIGRTMLGQPLPDIPGTSPGMASSANDAMHGRVTPLPDTDWQLAIQDMDQALNNRSK